MTGLCTWKRVKTKESCGGNHLLLDHLARESKMKTFTHLTVLILLIVPSAISQSSSIPSKSTTTPATTIAPTVSATVKTTPATTIAPTVSATVKTTPATTIAPTVSATVKTTPATTIAPTVSATVKTTPTTTITPTVSATVKTTPTTTIASTVSATVKTTPATTIASTVSATVKTTPATTIASTVSATVKTTPATTVKNPGTVPSVPSSNVTSPNTSNSTPDTTDSCQTSSCGGDSSCVNLNQSHYCLCMNGYYYQSSKCNKGKVFPGTIQIKVSEASSLEDKMSEAYEVLYMEIIRFFKDAFMNSKTYGQTVIHKVRYTPARSEMRASDQVVDVAVVNLFAETTQENETTINAAITTAISKNPDKITGFTVQDRCEFYGCVQEKDGCSDGLQCRCKEGLERPNPQTPFCLDPQCPDTCSAARNMQCLVKASVGAKCVCLPGYQKDERGSCQACAFGYSGVNCEDQFQLILTIVGTIAGVLILAMVIALILTRSKKKKDIEEENLIENDFQNLKLQQTTGFSNQIAEGSIFPKVRMAIPKDSQLQNPYISQRGMPRPDY
ncbi:mucin-13 [Saccopteryx bilineata]|uniref:mucin-13 n=1 Tax=Saccopteryx bilineata TaxID=59482 RepID=UPI00338FC936